MNQIAFESLTETVYKTESETTVEWLAWKLYGVASDENMQLIIDANDLFGQNTLEYSWRQLTIDKDKKIIYYT